MAKFNSNVYGENFATNESEMKKCSVFLQECLSKEDYENLKEAWNRTDKSIKWWQFAFQNISVSFNM